MKTNILFTLLLVLICLNQIYGKQKLLQNKEHRAGDILNTLGQSILQTNSENKVESKNQAGASGVDYREDIYLWEEGVTNLAYDDFLTTKFITNIEYLGTGYNAAYGNTLSTEGVDPGYTPSNAFKLKYKQDKIESLSVDADYFIPTGVTLHTKTSCQISYSAKEISSMKDYSDALGVSASFEGGGFGFTAKASAEYKQASSELEKSDSQYIQSTAKCSVHNLNINYYNQPEWGDDLKDALRELLRTDEDQLFWDFIEFYGTHVTVGVELGSSFRYVFEMKKSEVQKMKSMGLSVSVAAGGYGQEGSASTDYQKQSKEAFSDAMTNWSQYSIGAPPNADNDALAWAAASDKDPMPIGGKFTPWNIFVQKYSKNENNGFSKSDINTLSNKFSKYLQDYCEKFLVPRGIIENCSQETYSTNANSQQQAQTVAAVNYNCNSPVDIAPGSDVSTSGEYPGQDNKQKPISGSVSRRWPGTCYAADSDRRGFYTIDLGSIQPIKEINIYGRSDCCQERNNGLEIKLDGKTCYTNSSNEENFKTGNSCQGFAQQITVQGNAKHFTICGLQVMSCQ